MAPDLEAVVDLDERLRALGEYTKRAFGRSVIYYRSADPCAYSGFYLPNQPEVVFVNTQGIDPVQLHYDGVRVHDVLPQSEKFWNRLGAGYYDHYKNTRLDFAGSPAAARARPGGNGGLRGKVSESAATQTRYAEKVDDEPRLALPRNPLYAESHELSNNATFHRAVDGAELAALRRTAAGVERPQAALFLRVEADGRAIATGPKGARIPNAFRRFAHDHDLVFYAERRLPKAPNRAMGEGGETANAGSRITARSEPMPIAYRESGARYFGEDVGEAMDRSDEVRFSLPRSASKPTETPAFKRWFGDWEQASNQAHLRDKTVSHSSGDKIGSKHWMEPVDMRALRHEAKQWAKENLVGTYRNQRSGLELEVRRSGIDNALQHGGAADKIRAFETIKDVLIDGVVVFDGVNPKNQRGRLVVVAGKVEIGGVEYYVSAGFKEDINGRLLYDHEILEMERAERLSSQWGAAPLSKHPLPSAHLNDYTASFLGQEFAVSRVVDSDGKPLVVYHGTEAGEISEFKDSVANSTKDVTRFLGFFFTPSREWANEYANFSGQYDDNWKPGAVYPVYLAIKNPARLTSRFLFGEEHTAQEMRELRRKLEDQGHDGIIVDEGRREIIAFAPAQIKSAIGNNGDYAADNGDIRFSIPRAPASVNGAPGVAGWSDILRSPDVINGLREQIADHFDSQKSFNWWHRTFGTQFHKAKINRFFRPVFEGAQAYLDDTSRLANEAADLAPGLLPKTNNLGDAYRGIRNMVADKKDAQAIAGPVFHGTLLDRVFSDQELFNPPADEFSAPLFAELTAKQAGLYREYRAAIDKSLDDLAIAEMARLAKTSHLAPTPKGLPLDLSSRLGLSNLIPGTAVFKPSETNKTRDVVEIFGAAGGALKQAFGAFEQLQAGNPGKALKALAPKAISDAIKGSDMIDKGYASDSHGRRTVDATVLDGAVKAIGFNPTTNAEDSRARSIVMDQAMLYKSVQGKIDDRWAQGIHERDPAKIADAQEMLRQWNMQNPESKITPSHAAILRRAQQARLTADQRVINTAPKQMRAQMRPIPEGGY